MSGMQAALLIRREKQRLRGGKVVNFRELPSNLATRLIPPLPRYPPRSYVYGCGGQGPGKAAWQGCNRPSPLPLSPMSPHGCRGEGYKTKQCEAHRRWMKRNRIRDASYCYGSSGEDDEEDGSNNANRRRGEVSAAVNTVLYAGLGTTALGLVISFVGTGEKGFLSPELRLVATDKKEKVRKAEARPGGAMPTALLLSPMQQQPAMPSSCPVSTSTKGHELLLSPAQLPE
ncbi:hypothetical protein KM043_017495 [Ampulex compressa]|nr:hypothetical protein KM043_017495 [Ampulex compressa]